MHIDPLQQLSAWLAATDIAMLELRGPDCHVRLHRDGAQVIEVAAPAMVDTPSAQVPRLTVAAFSVGVFLHGHPLHTTPLAPPGASVRARAMDALASTVGGSGPASSSAARCAITFGTSPRSRCTTSSWRRAAWINSVFGDPAIPTPARSDIAIAAL